MNKEIKETLMEAVVSDTVKNVQNLFNKHKLELDDSFFDYELLKAALCRNHLGIVKFLLKFGCRVVKPNKSKSEVTLLHLAIKNAKSCTDEVIKKLIEKGASVYDKNHNGETPVHAAFKKGNFEAVEAILHSYHSLNFDTDSKSINKDDLLHFHIACAINDYYDAEKYLEYEIDPNSPLSLDSEEYAGLNPIQLAIKKNYIQLFVKLVKYNGDLSIKDTQGLTPLLKLYYSTLPNNGKNWIEQAFKKGNDKKFINSEDKYGVSHFHLCCMIDEPKNVQTFIDNGVNVNSSVSLKCPVNPGFTALHFAVKNCCLKVAKLFLKNGADPNKLSRKGSTPLHLACKKSENLRRDMIKLLLEHKANPAFANKKGCTPLHETFYYVNSEGLQTFNTLMSKIQWGSDNSTDKQGLSLFHIACTTNDVNQVIKFLDSGVDIDSSVSSGNYSGFTALHFAVVYNQKEVVKILLKKKAKVNEKAGESGITPLHLACEFNYMKFDQEESIYNWVRFQYHPVSSDCTYSRINQLEIIKLLLSHGCDINAKDSLGVTPLLHASMIDKNYFKLDWTYLSYTHTKERDDLSNEVGNRLKEIIEILIENKANIRARTNSQSSILHIISQYNTVKISEKLMKFLLVSGADVNAVDDAGLTPLHAAVKYNNPMLVRRLLKYNANPNIKCKNSRVPLHMVVHRIAKDYKIRERIKKEIFCALVEHGADVNIRDHDGSVMLLTAMSSLLSYKELVIEKLLYYGADINMHESLSKSVVSKILEWNRDEDWMVRAYGKMFQIIFVHVQKLLALGLPVSQDIQQDCNKIYPHYDTQYKRVRDLKSLENLFDKCIEELDRMKSIKIDFYTSLYDILLKDSQTLAMYINNNKLIKVIKAPNIDSEFPFYGFLLKLQFNRGLRRSEVLQSAEAALQNTLYMHLPNVCCNAVLKYLTNEDLTNLKEAVPVKRNLKRKLHGNNPNQAESESKLQKKE